PKHFFQYQTIAELALVAGSARVVAVKQGSVTGPVPLTPIQRWFFGQDLADPHRFIHSVLLELRRPMKPALLQQAFVGLLEHHDALRMRFTNNDGTWRQFDADTAQAAEGSVFRRIDLAQVADTNLDQQIQTAVIECQSSLSLATGPLIRA